MKIVNINYNARSGGPAGVIYRLHQEFRSRGHESVILAKHANGLYEKDLLIHTRPGGVRDLIRAILPSPGNTIRMRHLDRINQLQGRYERVSTDWTGVRNVTPKLFPEADIIQLNWVSDFFEWDAFFDPSNLKNSPPIFWRLPDFQAITGGCHYFGSCDGYLKDCENCPQIPRRRGVGNIAKENLIRRKKMFDLIPEGSLHFIAQSKWMEQVLSQSPLSGKFPITRIPNGVDTSVFFPLDKAFCRDALGISKGAKVILYTGMGKDVRRGGDLLFGALKNIHSQNTSRNLFFLTVGGGVDLGEFGSKLPGLQLGTTNLDFILRVVYSAADVTVVSSREDNFPNVALESLACGTPIAAFNTGGLSDIVTKDTGNLSENMTSQGLAEAIVQTLDAHDSSTRSACTQLVEEKFTLSRMADDYLSLYKGS